MNARFSFIQNKRHKKTSLLGVLNQEPVEEKMMNSPGGRVWGTMVHWVCWSSRGSRALPSPLCSWQRRRVWGGSCTRAPVCVREWWSARGCGSPCAWEWPATARCAPEAGSGCGSALRERQLWTRGAPPAPLSKLCCCMPPFTRRSALEWSQWEGQRQALSLKECTRPTRTSPQMQMSAQKLSKSRAMQIWKKSTQSLFLRVPTKPAASRAGVSVLLYLAPPPPARTSSLRWRKEIISPPGCDGEAAAAPWALSARQDGDCGGWRRSEAPLLPSASSRHGTAPCSGRGRAWKDAPIEPAHLWSQTFPTFLQSWRESLWQENFKCRLNFYFLHTCFLEKVGKSGMWRDIFFVFLFRRIKLVDSEGLWGNKWLHHYKFLRFDYTYLSF